MAVTQSDDVCLLPLCCWRGQCRLSERCDRSQGQESLLNRQEIQLSIDILGHDNLFMTAVGLDDRMIFCFILQDTSMPPGDFPPCCGDTRTHGEYSALSPDFALPGSAVQRTLPSGRVALVHLRGLGARFLPSLRQKWGLERSLPWSS